MAEFRGAVARERSKLRWIFGHEVITSAMSDDSESLVIASLAFNQFSTRTRNAIEIENGQ